LDHENVNNNKNPYSPYQQIVKNVSESFRKMEQNTIHPSEVAKVILQAVQSHNPDFRYIVGKDAAMILETKRNTTDRDFENFIREQFNLKT
jgi:hypothetical protein